MLFRSHELLIFLVRLGLDIFRDACFVCNVPYMDEGGALQKELQISYKILKLPAR